jgi:hypothetical protein
VQGRHLLLQGLPDQGVEGWVQGRVRGRCAGHVYGNLGTGHMYLNEHVKAVACFEEQHAMAISLKLAHMQSHAALNMGVALTLHVRAARQGPWRAAHLNAKPETLNPKVTTFRGNHSCLVLFYPIP